jgi:hypothetical protein
MNLLSRLSTSFNRRTHNNRCHLMVENLEDRLVPSTVSSIAGNFNGTAIPAGSTVWFNSCFTASGLPKSGQVTLHADNAAIDFTAGGVAYHVAVPNGLIVLTPGATSASVTYDPTDNDWDVSAPTGGTGNVFMGGVALQVPNGLPGGIKNVTWTVDLWSDTPGITVNWKWAASVYKSFSVDYNALNVKPVDSNSLSAYHNGDKSDTPEAFKALVTAGGMGDGGNNFTGNFTGAKSVQPALGDGLQDYPYASSNPLTSVAFNESTVLKAANFDTANGYFDVWYSDEHALALGVGTVVVKTASGTTTTNYPIAPLTSNPGAAVNPAVGTTATSGDQAGTDVSGRPMAPSLFITDTTNDPNNRSGDWQWGGTAYAPSQVFGTWKAFTRTVDYTTGSPTVTVTAPLDPAKNGWNLGAGSDAAPAGLTNEGYGAEIRWSLADLQNQGILIPRHTYRFYVIVHDGDQNKVGGDAGQASYNYVFPGLASQPGSLSGYVYGDSNLNGVRDAQDVAISGAVITLLDANLNVVAQTTTDVNGYYSFTNLPAGTYTIQETQPPGLLQGTNNLGSLGGTQGNDSFTVVLSPGANGTDYNFGEILPNPGI